MAMDVVLRGVPLTAYGVGLMPQGWDWLSERGWVMLVLARSPSVEERSGRVFGRRKAGLAHKKAGLLVKVRGRGDSEYEGRYEETYEVIQVGA